MSVAQLQTTGTQIRWDVTTMDFTITVASGAALTLRIAHAGAPAGNLTGVVWDPSGANQAMTLQGGAHVEDADGHRCSIYTLATPTAGSAVVRATFATNNGAVACADTWSGVDISGTPFAGYNTSTATSQASPSSVSTSASAASGDMVIDAMGWAWNGATVTDDASPSVQDYNGTENNIGYAQGAGSHTTATGTVTSQWTYTGNITRAMATLILKAGATDISAALSGVFATGQIGTVGATGGILVPRNLFYRRRGR